MKKLTVIIIMLFIFSAVVSASVSDGWTEREKLSFSELYGDDADAFFEVADTEGFSAEALTAYFGEHPGLFAPGMTYDATGAVVTVESLSKKTEEEPEEPDDGEKDAGEEKKPLVVTPAEEIGKEKAPDLLWLGIAVAAVLAASFTVVALTGKRSK